ncbi:hypothetical protein TSAR_007655 [Trichomalopsis sarcophagae]|uniref:Myosin motor domain-containing protein n=1 Tax=Trichomalopsis sarcophagae TaxID=543379 RepID=A0A232FC21_9HYME|nr:hypothetical protein TSAR_007655 [Trichomalopsis sarcophagae]
MNAAEARKAPARRTRLENLSSANTKAAMPVRRGPRLPEPPVADSRPSSMRNREEAAATATTTKKKNETKSKGKLKSESFHTLPREPFSMISRKDIIRRTCSKTEDQNDPLTRLTQSLRKRWRRSSLVKKRNSNEDNDCPSEGEEDDSRRPRTLPSICRRSSGKDRDAGTMTLVPLTRISRQEIIRRTSSGNEEVQRRKSCGSLYNADSRHAGCFVKNTGVGSTNARTRASDRWRSSLDERPAMQVPRPSTLPKIARSHREESQHKYVNSRTLTKDSANKQEASIYGRIRRRKASVPNLNGTRSDSNSVEEATLTRVRRTGYRSIRDPASDPPNYGMLDYRSTGGGASLPNLPQRTMSRRRIIDNAEEARVVKSLGRVKRDKNEDERYTNTLPSTAHDHDRLRRRNAMAAQKNGHWYEPPPPPVAPPRKNSVVTTPEDPSMATGSSKSLPSYVKKARKASCIPLRIDRPRDDFASKSLNRLSNGQSSRESGDGVIGRKSSTGTPPYSIFGLCTGRRKVQQSRQPSRTEEDSPAMNPYRARNPRTGELVWFDPGVGHVLPGEVLEYHRAANVLSVQAVIAGKPQVFTLTNLNGVKPRQDLGQNGVEDMIQLSDLNEASLLWNLKIRYDKELIYTYTGSILVAVNPYKMFDIYGLDQVKLYEGRILGTLPPHLFAVGSSAYSQVSAANNASANQVVVISGESGSGKTESTKLVMQYLAAVNRAPSNLVTEQILEAAPLLESFGNAKTPRNDNSSRFGKYLEVFFRDGVIVGGRVTQYLLEKSRIVTQATDERNYHVFYELLAGLDQQLRDKYGLLTPDKYFYLNQGGSCDIDGKNDTQDFKALLSAMQVLGFTSEEQDTIFKILSSVLHLGNVYFHRKQMRHGQEGVEVGSDAEIRWAAHLLQINSDGIIRALTTKTTVSTGCSRDIYSRTSLMYGNGLSFRLSLKHILNARMYTGSVYFANCLMNIYAGNCLSIQNEARNERVLTALNIDQALDARDAFAKALYSSLFSWLVARVNHIVYKGTKQTAAISILDIFGFENFAENSFEQLCINYANENLHFYFNKHIFKLEQQEYAKEKIDWTTINYTDNLPIIHLIAKKPVGILHLLDDESNFPKATDLSFLEKCHYNHALSELYSRPRMNSAEFAIRHYAGQVWYNVDGFLDKNRDTLRPDVVELLISSKINMVSKMFQHVRNAHEANKTINKPNGRFVTMKPRTPTVSARFHDSLQQLLESMSQCNPWFVRCIKPNSEKAPMKFDMPCVLEQLRYTGMLETIRIRKTGYPVRLPFAHFVDRYRYLVPTSLPRGAPNKELCRMILEKAAPKENEPQYQLGLTRVFLRESLERTLEYNRALILERAAVTVQRYTRGFLARRRFLNISRSTVLLQAVYRGYRERKKFRAMKRGVIMAQKLYRGKKQREKFRVLKEEIAKRAEMERASRERAKAKQQREEQERASRAVAGVNHLEIPAELAFIYSKLDDWQPTHTERNLIKVVGSVVPLPINYALPSDIDQYQFSKFTNIYFKSHIFGMKREPIKTPFLAKARDQDYTDSLMIFKLILRFMNENNLSGKREQALGDYIVNKGIVNEKLRDEILCQLANQTWKNENDANKERGWLLLSNCLSAFHPSRTLYKYILKYVSDHAYDGYKAFCQRKLLQAERVLLKTVNSNNQTTVQQVPRNYPPSVLEWRANRNRVNMALTVGFYDGETTTCAVDSWTTCEELANLAIQNHGVENSGWTITLWNQLEGSDAIVTETNGFDYVLDLVSEMELAPAFPAAKHMFLEQRKNSFPPIKKREHAQVIRELEQEQLLHHHHHHHHPQQETPILKTFQPLERKLSAVPKPPHRKCCLALGDTLMGSSSVSGLCAVSFNIVNVYDEAYRDEDFNIFVFRNGTSSIENQSGVAQPRSPPAPVEPKGQREVYRASPDSDAFDQFVKSQRDMFGQNRDMYSSQQQQHESKASKDYYGKDMTDLGGSTTTRNSDFDSRRDIGSDIFSEAKYARDVFESSNSKRDPFGMTRDVSPKSRDSFGMPSSRDIGVVPNTRDSFAVARQSFKKMDGDADRRSSVASTMVFNKRNESFQGTQRTDKMERIEIEEWPEFLKPVLPPAEKPEIEKVQEVVDTKLYPQTSSTHFTYNRVTWTLRVKKEVFAPNETLTTPLALHLVFCQVAYDVLATSNIRISKEDRQNMLKLLDNYGVTLDNLQSTQHKITIKKNVVDMAKQWPLYFARIFPVSIGPQQPDVQHVAVSHHGLRLIKRSNSGDLIILETLPLEEIVSVNSSRPGVCTLQVASGVRLPLHTNRATQLADMIAKYIRMSRVLMKRGERRKNTPEECAGYRCCSTYEQRLERKFTPGVTLSPFVTLRAPPARPVTLSWVHRLESIALVPP